ncbi:MAG: response regulator transcription factor [Hyphomicrobiales bacterium]
MTTALDSEPIVFVIDDDASVRDSLKNLLESVGLRAELFDSTQSFLGFRRPDTPSCLVLDVRLPGLTGLEFQSELHKLGIALPIIFITGHGDIPMSVRAMKLGAVEFLTKPFRDQDLLESVRLALEKDRTRRREDKARAALHTHFESLTAREKEVIGLISAGLSNKQIATAMGISDATAKVHRANIMRKMEARSLAELVRMADLLGVGQQSALSR